MLFHRRLGPPPARPRRLRRPGKAAPHARRGVTTVPTVLGALFLAVMLLCMFEVRRAAYVPQALESAARKGCEYGIKPHHTYGDIVRHVHQVLRSNQLSDMNPTITVEVAGYAGLDAANRPSWGSFVTVTADAAYRPKPFDLVSVRVSLPASKVRWFTGFHLKDLHVTSSPVIMMREG